MGWESTKPIESPNSSVRSKGQNRFDFEEYIQTEVFYILLLSYGTYRIFQQQIRISVESKH